MPREQLLGLTTDVDRLLAAGASAAGGSDSLRRRAKTLRELGKQVAALKPIADAIARVTQAAPTQVGSAFLDLVGMSRQIRASLATAGLAGDLQPLPQRGPWQTPLPVRDVEPLHQALAEAGPGREQALRDALARNAVDDLRLLPALLEALGDGHAPVADLVMNSALPVFGPAIVDDLRARLDLQGKAADSRRLALICQLDPSAGAELCRQALNDGNATLRIQALECLVSVVPPQEAEQAGLRFCEEKKSDLRQAALRALGEGAGNAALEALIAALGDKDDPIMWCAIGVLAALPNPQTTARLLRELETQLAAVDKPIAVPKKGKSKPPKADAERQQRLTHAGAILRVLGRRTDDQRQAAAAVVLPLARHADPGLRQAAVDALGGLGSAAPEVVPALIEALSDDEEDVALEAVAALKKIPPARCPAVVPALLDLVRDKKSNFDLRVEAVRLLPSHATRFGDQIIAVLRDLLKEKKSPLRVAVAEALAAIGPRARSAVPDLLEVLRQESDFYSAAGALCCRLEPEGATAIPGLIPLLADRKPNARSNAISELAGYGLRAQSALPALLARVRAGDLECDYADALVAIDPEGTTVLPELIAALDVRKASVRRGALVAIGKYHAKAQCAEEVINQLLMDGDRQIAHLAEFILRRIHGA
jgi:HEAT repeat protein